MFIARLKRASWCIALEMATPWVVLEQPWRLNGALRCGVDVVHARSGRPSAQAPGFDCVWRLALATAWVATCESQLSPRSPSYATPSLAKPC